jgi:hypothetical protein
VLCYCSFATDPVTPNAGSINHLHLTATILTLFFVSAISAQEPPDTSLNQQQVTRFLHSLRGRMASLDAQTGKGLNKWLGKLEKQESKLKKKVQAKDSTAAQHLFTGTDERYNRWKAQLNGTDTTAVLKEYIPEADTLATTLKYLEGKADPKQLAEAKQLLQQYQSKLQVANTIKQQLKQRQQELTSRLKEMGLVKELQGWNKQAYYYSAQLSEYKALLKDRKKAEQKVLAALRQTKLYKDFLKKHSQLAKLFGVPENYGSPQSLIGLQTRASVQQQLQQRLGGGTSTGTGATNAINPQALIAQQLQQAQSQLNQLKNQLKLPGGSSNDLAMPDFTPNSQRTKTFWKRVRYGLDVSSQKSNRWLPSLTTIALSAGYQFTDGCTAGFSIAYKLGWGQPFSHIRFSHEGIGLRSFVDVKLKGSLWLTGGYELNYLQSIRDLEATLKNLDAWQKSALAGLTKKTKLKGKKEVKVQLLYDFLHAQHQPVTPEWQFRVGWGW